MEFKYIFNVVSYLSNIYLNLKIVYPLLYFETLSLSYEFVDGKFYGMYVLCNGRW